MYFDDIYRNIKRGRSILFDAKSACLCGLLSALGAAERRVAVLWALEGAKIPAERLGQFFPGDGRFLSAVRAAEEWSEGKIKMPAARRMILAVHSAAGESASPVAAALCHAVGQACSAVHSPRHAPGLAFYELTAVARESPAELDEERIGQKIEGYFELLAEAERLAVNPGRAWAGFLRR